MRILDKFSALSYDGYMTLSKYVAKTRLVLKFVSSKNKNLKDGHFHLSPDCPRSISLAGIHKYV
jgi:hypothetical protein